MTHASACLFMLLLTCTLCYSAKLHITCDFDLENIISILPHLPDECTTIYNERFTNPQLYQMHLEESQTFEVFYTKLDNYERRNITNINNFEAGLREEIYTRVDLAACIVTATASAAQYLDCVEGKRLELIDLVPYV